MPTVLPIETLGGITQVWNPPYNSAEDLVDATWTGQGGWRTCGGYRAILEPTVMGSAFAGVGRVTSITWFSQHNGGPQFLVWEHGSNLAIFNGSTRSYNIFASDRFTTSQPWQRTQYCAVNNNLYIVNGEGSPLRFDGEKLIVAGFANAPMPPQIAATNENFIETTTYGDMGLGERNDQSNGRGNGQYAYVITEVLENGTESPPSPVAGPVKWVVEAETTSTAPGYKCFIRVTIPKVSGNVVSGENTGRRVVARRLYRTKNNYRLSGGRYNTVTIGGTEYADGAIAKVDIGQNYFTKHSTIKGIWLANTDSQGPATPTILGDFYFLLEFQYGDRFIFIDAIPDSRLGSKLEPSEFGPWPRGAKYIAHYKGTLWLSGMPEYPNRVVYSSPVLIENFPPANYFTLGQADSGEVTAMRASQNVLVVFKRKGIYIVRGDPSRGFHADTLTEEVGCVACNTVRDVPGVGLVFVATSGVYALSGNLETGQVQVRPISNSLQDTWKWRISTAALVNACAEVYERDKEYWLSLPMDGQPENSMVFVYHYEIGQWSRRTNFPIGCMTTSRDHREYLFFGSNDNNDHPGVHLYSHGWPDKDGISKGFVYRSSPIDIDGKYKHFKVMRVILNILNRGNTNALLTYIIDRRSTAVGTAQQRDQQDPKDLAPVWDTDVWSTSEIYMRQHPTAIRFDVAAQCQDFQYRITATDIELTSVFLDIEPGQGRILEPNAVIGPGVAPDR